MGAGPTFVGLSQWRWIRGTSATGGSCDEFACAENNGYVPLRTPDVNGYVPLRTPELAFGLDVSTGRTAIGRLSTCRQRRQHVTSDNILQARQEIVRSVG
jgi:hypothetical protein